MGWTASENFAVASLAQTYLEQVLLACSHLVMAVVVPSEVDHLASCLVLAVVVPFAVVDHLASSNWGLDPSWVLDHWKELMTVDLLEHLAAHSAW